MTIERRAQITTGVLIVFVLGVGLILFWSSRQVEEGIKRIDTTSQAVHSAFMLRVVMDEYLAHRGTRTLGQWEKHREALGKILDEMPSESIDPALLADLKDSYGSVTALAPKVIRTQSSRQADDHSQDAKIKEMVTLLMLLRLEQLVNAANDLSTATQSLTLRRKHFVQQIILAVSVSMVIVILINIYLIRKSVVHPLKILSRGAEKIGAGNFDYVKEIKSDDEVGNLAQAFSTMIEGLEKRDVALKKAREELEMRVRERTMELQRSNEELKRSNDDLEYFAYVASHDLQEPLRNVASCLQLLEKKYNKRLDADADQYIHYAVESAVRMKELIQNLLTFSRIATRGMPPEPTDCEQILDQTLKNLKTAISEAGAVVTHDPLPTIPADDAQLLQAFQNLIANAIKFRGDDPPRVHVSAVKNKSEWVFSVKDNGIGIESQHLDRIFVIFQRLHKRSQYDGTGMGLAIVKKVVERHHGRVWVESELGVGTTFYFTIPDTNVRSIE